MKDAENRIRMPGSPPLFPLPTPARPGQEQEKRIEELPGGINYQARIEGAHQKKGPVRGTVLRTL
jgi:hypothetical protein